MGMVTMMMVRALYLPLRRKLRLLILLQFSEVLLRAREITALQILSDGREILPERAVRILQPAGDGGRTGGRRAIG
jgi:hypothetical protein